MPDAVVRGFIANPCQAATPAADYPSCEAVDSKRGAGATLGFRPAGESRLFCEEYRDEASA